MDEELASVGEYEMVDVKVKEYNDSAWLRLIDRTPPAARDA